MKSFRIVFSGLSLVFILLVIIPLVNMIATSDVAVLGATLADQEVLSSILLTLRTALWATIACLFLGLPLAYLLARRQFPGKSLVQGIVDLPIMIPHTAMGIALLMIYGRKFLLK